MVIVRPSTVDEMIAAPNFAALCEEYANESGITELGRPDVDVDQYRAMIAADVGALIGAWNGGELAGFGFVTFTVLPHFSKLAGCLISFFVTERDRRSGAGTEIRKLAEHLSRERGAIGLLISAPRSSRPMRSATNARSSPNRSAP